MMVQLLKKSVAFFQHCNELVVFHTGNAKFLMAFAELLLNLTCGSYAIKKYESADRREILRHEKAALTL